MITPMVIQDMVGQFLKREVADKIQLKTYIKKDRCFKMKNPQIVTGFLLPKGAKDAAQADESDDFPYIGTRILKVQHTKEWAVVTLKILFGAYCPGSQDENGNVIEDSSGYRDIWNLIEATRISLCSQGTIMRKSRLNPDKFSAEIPEEQPYPYWEGWALTEWEVALPSRTKGYAYQD